MAQIFSLIIGYFIGALLQTAYWYGKRQNIDVRDYGSGNSGATNVIRTLGKKAGIITAVGDILKVFLSALICWLIFRGTGMPTALIFLYSGLGTIIGHNYPFFMGFKGGKGVATTAGVIISLFFQPNALWVMTLIGVITFFGVLILTRYVSLASLVLVTEFMIEFIIWSGSGNTQLRGSEIAQGICLVIIIAALCYLRHLGNIERLLDGNERRFGEKKSISQSSHRRTGRDEREDHYDFEDDDKDADIVSDRYSEEDFEVKEKPDRTGKDTFTEEPAEGFPENDFRVNESYEENIDTDIIVDELAKEAPDESPVEKVGRRTLEQAPKRKFIWDDEKQCYVRYRESDLSDER